MVTANCNPQQQQQQRDNEEPSPPSSPILSLLLQFNSLQSDRVKLYKRFEDAFSAHLLGALNAETYDETVKTVTQGFSEISMGIRRVEADLRDRHGRDDIALLIRQVQLLEKTKLETTAEFQIYAKESVHGAMDYEQQVAESRLRLVDIVESINDKLEEIRCEVASL